MAPCAGSRQILDYLGGLAGHRERHVLARQVLLLIDGAMQH